jgi:hypothetical protein
MSDRQLLEEISAAMHTVNQAEQALCKRLRAAGD